MYLSPKGSPRLALALLKGGLGELDLNMFKLYERAFVKRLFFFFFFPFDFLDERSNKK